MSVCQNIKAVAEVRGISIKELSRRVDIPYTTLYNMLNRDSERFDLNLLEQIAQSLDVSVGILMGSAVPSMTEFGRLRWNINGLRCAQHDRALR